GRGQGRRRHDNRPEQGIVHRFRHAPRRDRAWPCHPCGRSRCAGPHPAGPVPAGSAAGRQAGPGASRTNELRIKGGLHWAVPWKESSMEQFARVLRKDGQALRYLIVDDSVFARKNLSRMIESFGGQVAGEAGDGRAAIAEYDRLNPDLVLMDITMPEMEGIEAAELIVRQHSEARVIMVSSVGYQENIVAALQRGARHFVQKPVKAEVLYEVIKYVMGEECVVAKGATQGS